MGKLSKRKLVVYQMPISLLYIKLYMVLKHAYILKFLHFVKPMDFNPFSSKIILFADHVELQVCYKFLQ